MGQSDSDAVILELLHWGLGFHVAGDMRVSDPAFSCSFETFDASFPHVQDSNK